MGPMRMPQALAGAWGSEIVIAGRLDVSDNINNAALYQYDTWRGSSHLGRTGIAGSAGEVMP